MSKADGMVGRDYLARQATTLLLMAKTIKDDPKLSAGLATKAADLKERLDQTPLAPDAPTGASDADIGRHSDG